MDERDGTSWSNAGPWADRGAEDLIADMEAASAKIAALPPHPVRVRMPSTVLTAFRGAVPEAVEEGRVPLVGLPRYDALPIEIDNDLPHRTVRIVYSDGTERDERV